MRFKSYTLESTHDFASCLELLNNLGYLDGKKAILRITE